MKFYLSHKISGLSGAKATDTEQMKNRCEAIEIGKQIKNAFTANVELYVPGGATEEFVSIVLKDNYLNIEQVLAIDCKIIDTCDALLIYVPEGDELQGGRLVEYDHAVCVGKPICSFANVDQAVAFITKFILE